LLYPILDTSHLHGHALVDVISAALDAGADWIQVRHKLPFDRDFANILEQCAHLKPDLILNDRADYAALFGFGLHVGQSDLPPSEARAIIGPHALLGYSTHSQAQLDDAQNLPVNYLAIGPIYSTSSKLNPDPVVGPGPFVSRHPLVAIGGLTLENSGPVVASGIQRVAVISALWQPPYTLKSFQSNIQRWLNQLSSFKASVSSTPP